MSKQAGDGTIDIAIGGTLFVLVGKIEITLLATIAAVVFFVFGADPRHRGSLMAGYAIVALCILWAMLVASQIGYYGLPH